MKNSKPSILAAANTADAWARHPARFLLLIPVALGLLLVGATPPGGFVDAPFATGLGGSTAMAFAPDGRLFVCEKGPGTSSGSSVVRVFSTSGGAPLSTFHTFTVDSRGERGIGGIALDPNFSANRFVYVYYTVPGATSHNRVTRLVANGNVSTGIETPILDLEDLGLTQMFHNGGAIHFGPDGKLYVAVGENVTPMNAQDVTNRLGKILRINPDGTIPGDNPASFTVTDSAGNNPTVAVPAGANRAIWALGLRNPFTFSFQPGTGRMFINDVGDFTWEEINEGIAGSNYGWFASVTDGPTTNPSFRSPLYAYNHTTGNPTGYAITGGTFYNPSVVQFPSSYLGKYFFSDFVNGWIWLLDPGTGTASQFATGAAGPVDLAIGPDGALYYSQLQGTSVGRISYTGVATQSIIVSTTYLSVNEGSTAVVNARLAVNPGGTPVTVDVAMALGDSSVTVSPPQLTFTSGTWNVDQAVTVTAAQDTDASDDGATVALSSAGLATRSVVVTALDDDRPGGSPTASIALPKNGSVVSGATGEFFGNGTGAGLSKADFTIDGILASTDTGTTGHYHFGGRHNDWNTTVLADGVHVLRMTVTGSGGTGSHEITVIVSNPVAISSGGGSSGGSCGSLGLEAILLIGLAALRRRRPTR